MRSAFAMVMKAFTSSRCRGSVGMLRVKLRSIFKQCTSNRVRYGSPARQFSISLGCDVRHASRLVYSKGLNLGDPASATPIGAGCKVCDRRGCAQRAFPAIGRPL
ncbi:MAG: DUF2083 domain-containing protein [Burkholderiales bacterium]|nr:DUF2083 domain-containing protein [Burkholderiales bacterium]